jgi:hypothetical protein
MSPRRGEVCPPFPIRSHGEPLSGIPRRGLLHEQWPTMGGTHDDGA